MTRFALVALVACGTPPVPAAPSPAHASDHELRDETLTEGSALHTRISGRDVDLARLPIAELIGLPMSGKADVAVDVVVPIDHGRRDFRGAAGSIDARCDGTCRIGDDQAKLRLAPKISINFGHIDLSEVEIHATIGGGHVTVTRWTAKGSDGIDAIVAGQIDLARELDDSAVAGCVRVALPELEGALSAVHPDFEIAPRASDGRRNVRIVGTLGAPQMLMQVCDGSVPLQPDRRPDEVVTAPPPPPPPADEDLGPFFDQTIHPSGTNQYDIDRALIDRVLANPMALAKGVRVVPAMKNGKAGGFKLYAIRPDSLFARLGFENGDAVVRVNGFDLTTADQALEVYTKLRDATSLQIDVERRGQPVSITLTIQ
ncbi:MAG TPA: type II secretion system protein GspC [Kofleriaceae bacterium]|jgi:hypothetical protein